MSNRILPPAAALASALVLAALAAAPARAADLGYPPDYGAYPSYRPRLVDDPRLGPPCACRPEVSALPPRRPRVTVETYARPTPDGGWSYGTRARGYGPYGPVSTGFAGYAAVDPYTGAVYRRQTYW